MSTTSIDFVACKRRSKCLRSSKAFSFYLGNIQTNIRREQSTPNKQILGRVHYYDEDNVNDCGGWPRRLLEQSGIIVSFRNILFRHKVDRLLGKERHSPWTFCSVRNLFHPWAFFAQKVASNQESPIVLKCEYTLTMKIVDSEASSLVLPLIGKSHRRNGNTNGFPHDLS